MIAIVQTRIAVIVTLAWCCRYYLICGGSCASSYMADGGGHEAPQVGLTLHHVAHSQVLQIGLWTYRSYKFRQLQVRTERTGTTSVTHW